MLFAIWASGSVVIMFLNLFYLMILQWRIAMRGDRYIKANYPELYARYYRHNWSGNPMFIAVCLLLFDKQEHPKDLEALKHEAKCFALWAMPTAFLGMILLIFRMCF